MTLKSFFKKSIVYKNSSKASNDCVYNHPVVLQRTTKLRKKKLDFKGHPERIPKSITDQNLFSWF